MKILAAALLVLLAGCASPRPRVVAGPLQEIAAAREPAAPAAVKERVHSALVAEGPVVVGPRGHALNVASSLHRVFQALGIPSEIRCQPSGPGADRRQIQIRFPSGLSESQQEDVRLLLGLIGREVASL